MSGSFKHGHAPKYEKRSLTYNCWKDMRKRCNNPNATRYERYGGRGIKVCERWNSFENFLADMGEAGPGMSMERIDYDGNYEPSNCKWIPRARQSSNRSMCRKITFNGETKNLADWERDLGLYKGAIFSRESYGWPIEKILTTPRLRQ